MGLISNVSFGLITEEKTNCNEMSFHYFKIEINDFNIEIKSFKIEPKGS